MLEGRRCDDGVRVCEEKRRAQALEADRIAEDAGPDIVIPFNQSS